MPQEKALRVLERGFWDMHIDEGQTGVWCEDRPRDGVRAAPGVGVIMGGPDGNTVLCTDIPDEVFTEREVSEGTRGLTEEEMKQLDAGIEPEGMEYQHMGYAIIPAEILNQFGRPQLWDHNYSGGSREQLLDAISALEQSLTQKDIKENDEDVRRHVSEMRAGIEFLDRVGWQKPLSLRETAPEDYAAPQSPWFKVEGFEPEDE
jgi:hypothetical protein